MSMKLRELIRAVRACKTAAEERAVIAKECALIRSSIKTVENPYRHRNVAKLLYMQMLGYPTHFGQMECVKLIAAPSFPEKRIGYLGFMVLLDDRAKLVMLVTNSMKNDFQHKNPYIVGLALAALGNICSADMARDLAPEVEKFFRSPNAYIRKKAALCATRCVRKVPELAEDFVNGCHQLLNDKNHAVLLTACTLIIEILSVDPKQITPLRKLVPTIVRLLKNLVLAGYVSEYDVVGITDPFLQCRLIHILRLFGTGDREASDAMNDILAQVAINTEPTKNPGNAILYEAVQCIMSIEAEGGLRVLAINILGRFLSNSRDNNIRYVALQTLCKCVNRDTQAIQRHRNTIVDCLKDSDVSIRRRALDLIYALVTRQNVKALVKELLNYLALTSGDNDFKTELTEKICLVVERFAPSKHWHIDTIVTVLAAAGNFTRENVATDLITLIARSSVPLQAYATHLLYHNIAKKTKHAQVPLLHVAMWCFGEFGEFLVSDDGLSKANEVVEAATAASGGASSSSLSSSTTSSSTNFSASFCVLPQSKVMDVIVKVMSSPVSSHITRQYVLNALVKLSNKFSEQIDRLRQAINTYQSSIAVELQQRSVEYATLSSAQLSKIRPSIVARMPVPTKAKQQDAFNNNSNSNNNNIKPLSSSSGASSPRDEESEREEPDEDEGDEVIEDETEEEKKAAIQIPKGNAPVKKELPPNAAASPDSSQVDLFDLAIFGASNNNSAASSSSSSSSASSSSSSSASVDLLADFFTQQPPSQNKKSSTVSSGAASSSPMDALFGSSAVSITPSPTNPLMDPLFSPQPTSTPAVALSAPSSSSPSSSSAVKVFEANGLRVDFVFGKDATNDAITQVTAMFSNATPNDLTNFDFQVAVLKHVTLTMQPASSSMIGSNTFQAVSQKLSLNNSQHGKKKLAIRVKIDYNTAGKHVTEQTQFDKFPN